MREDSIATSRSPSWKGARVLVILPLWAPSYRGKNIGKLLKALCDSGAKPCVFAEDGRYSGDLKIWNRDIESVFFPNGGSRLMAFIRLFLSRRFDLVLWTYSGYHENAVLAALRRFGGPPFVIKSDSRVEHAGSSWRRVLGRHLFFRWPGRCADLILVETEDVRSKASEIFDPARLYKFPNGVDVESFRRSEKEFVELPPPLSGPYVLFTGRLAHEKGIDVLIEAFALASTGRPQWRLVIVGPEWEPEYAAACRDRAQELAGSKIVFVEEKFGKDLLRWYHACSIYVLPSRHEGLPNRLPEAMFFSKPVIASKVGQVPAMIDDGVGELVAPDDIGALSAALERIMDDAGVREKMGMEARRRIESDFDDQRLFPDLLARCSRILS